ncbi:MAG: hypothetical protein MUE60_14120, partial [Candidatus Eisenbacteria bacterium]|nr:hypothetical protein [Candidatus Eisenbacteria bacterium]
MAAASKAIEFVLDLSPRWRPRLLTGGRGRCNWPSAGLTSLLHLDVIGAATLHRVLIHSKDLRLSKAAAHASVQRENGSKMRNARLRRIGAMIILAAVLILLVSSFVDWRTPAWGILIWGHRTDVFLGALGLALMGISLVVFSFGGRTRRAGLLAGLLLALSSSLFGLSLVEWYLRHPSRLRLRVASRIL